MDQAVKQAEPRQTEDVARLEARHLLKALRAFKRGDFSARLPSDLHGIDGEIAEAFNDVLDLNQRMAREFRHLSRVVGKEGKINRRGKLQGAEGSWQDCVDSVNDLIEDMVQPTTEDLGPGVDIVVGDKFAGLVKAPRKIKAQTAGSGC